MPSARLAMAALARWLDEPSPSASRSLSKARCRSATLTCGAPPSAEGLITAMSCTVEESQSSTSV